MQEEPDPAAVDAALQRKCVFLEQQLAVERQMAKAIEREKADIDASLTDLSRQVLALTHLADLRTAAALRPSQCKYVLEFWSDYNHFILDCAYSYGTYAPSLHIMTPLTAPHQLSWLRVVSSCAMSTHVFCNIDLNKFGHPMLNPHTRLNY